MPEPSGLAQREVRAPTGGAPLLWPPGPRVRVSDTVEVSSSSDVEELHLPDEPRPQAPRTEPATLTEVHPRSAAEGSAPEALAESLSEGSCLLWLDAWQEPPVLERRPSWRALASPTWGPGATELVRVANDDLQEAALRGDLGLARRLVLAGASVNAPMQPESDSEYMCLLHILASKPELPNGARIIMDIIQGKANLNVRSSLGTTPLARACLSKHVQAVEVLLDAKADVSPLDDYGCKAARCAILPSGLEGAGPEEEAKSVQVIQLLARFGANLDDGGDLSPIVEAVRALSSDCVLALLEGNATPDGLHDAVEKAPLSLITELIKAEANPFMKDANGKTVMDLALARGNDEVTTLLRDYIGDLQRKQHPHLKTLEEQMRLENDPALMLAGMDFDARKTRMDRGGFERAGKHSRSQLDISERVARVQHFCKKISKYKAFQFATFAFLLLALFLPDLWVLMNIPTNDKLDICLLVILMAFIVEFAVQIIGFWSSYRWTFFFWMDLVGILSVPLDLSPVTNHLSFASNNTVVMRAARMTKLGARAGRFSKLVKLLRFLPGMKNLETGGTAKVISACLNRALSTRVSFLIIILVIILPAFSLVTYPDNDYSMLMWTEEVADTASTDPNSTDAVLAAFEAFYADESFFPFQVYVKFKNKSETTIMFSRSAPQRLKNQLTIAASSGAAVAQFNFQVPNQVDSLCNCLLIVTIIILIMGAALVMSSAVSGIVVVPVEMLFDNVQKVASKIFHSVTSMAGKTKESLDSGTEDVDDSTDPMGAETRLLEKVLAKLANLSEIRMKASPMDADQFERMGEGDRSMLQGYGGCEPRGGLLGLPGLAERDDEDQEAAMELAEIAEQKIMEAGIPPEAYNAWDTNVADFDDFARHQLCLAIVMMHHGPTSSLEEWGTACSNFIDGAAKLYKKVGVAEEKQALYHNWVHAVDVTFTASHILRLCGTEHFLNNNERFALIIAAVCHDMGHWGFTNQFLIQTNHELAIRYNDQSPLQMMHAAQLFELSKQPRMAIFADFERAQYREVRSVCIEAILHTDSQHHFPMVKEIQSLYDMNQELFDISDDMYSEGSIEFPSKEVVDFARNGEIKKHLRVAMVHLSDISNPMKPWSMAQGWANLLIEEMLRQGDLEKQLGLPVQALHDRDKLNKAYSQVGYIEFFVAPLLFGLARMTPLLNGPVECLMANMEGWYKTWLEETVPSEEERQRVCDRIVKLHTKRRQVPVAPGMGKAGSHLKGSSSGRPEE